MPRAGCGGVIQQLWDGRLRGAWLPWLICTDVVTGPRTASFSPDGHAVLVIFDSRRRVVACDVRTGAEIFRVGQDQDFFESAGFRPDGETFLVTSEGKPIALYEAATGEMLRRYR